MHRKTFVLWPRRISISLFFFFFGFIFATWASRIPAIQQQLKLSDTTLGLVLLGLPVGSFLALPFSGFAIPKYGSRFMLVVAALIYCVLLGCIGAAQNTALLTLCLFLFGASGNVLNIAVNSQAIALEGFYGKTIISSFHGVWSVAALVAAFIANIFIAKGTSVWHHFLVTSFAGAMASVACAPLLLRDEPVQKATRRPFFTKPGKSLVVLGTIAFCSFICQGAMFDWSGIYFTEIVTRNPALIGYGYTAFMISMTGARFVTDWLHNRIGFRKIIMLCGFLITGGLIISIVFPSLFGATVGFFLTGIGVSPAVPLVFSAAGKFRQMPTPVAIAAVSSIGMVGLLIGPPVVGFVAGLTTLKISFLLLSLFGIVIAAVAVRGQLEE
jgi:MFS family permease